MRAPFVVLLSMFTLFSSVKSIHEWTEIPSSTDVGMEECQPLPKEGANCVILGDNFVCMNGYFPCFSQSACGQSNVYQDKLYVYNVNTNRWTCLSPPTPNLTGDRVFSTMWAREATNEVYFFAGVNILCGGTPVFPVLQDMWKINIDTNTWTNLTATMTGTPGARLGSGYAKISDDLFALHGGLNGFFGAENDMWYYNASSNAWTQIQASLHNDTLRPHGRFNFQFVCNPDATFPLCVVAFGDTLEGAPLNEAWTFNKNTLAWTQIAAPSALVRRTKIRHPVIAGPVFKANRGASRSSTTQPGDRTQFCGFLKQKGSSKLFFYAGFGDADDAPRCDNAVTGYGDNPSRAFWVIRVDVAGGEWVDVTNDVIGDARETKSPACAQIDNVAYMNFGHKFTCPKSNSTGLPLPNERLLKWRIPNP